MARVPQPRLAVGLALSLGLVACQKEITTSFPEGLEPLSENSASWPGSTSSTELSVVAERGEDYAWAHGRGYIQADLDTVYAAVSTAEACVDRREVAAWEVTWDTEPDYDVSFEITSFIEDIIDFDYDTAWRHGPTEADEDGVITTYGSRWQLTELRASLETIKLMRGSVQLTEVEPGITGFEIIEELDSLQPNNDAGIATTFITDRFADVQALAAGEDLPELGDEAD